MSKTWSSIFLLLFTSSPFAEEGWLIATQNEVLESSISVDVVKPSNVSNWPNELSLTLTDQSDGQVITLTIDPESTGVARRRYTGSVQPTFHGEVKAQLSHQHSNRLLMVANNVTYKKDALKLERTMASQTEQQVVEPIEKDTEAVVLIPEPLENRTITANEPLYFIVGSSGERDYDARFQISFKYRPFDPDSTVATFIPYASNIYFAYTQTSIWDLGSESSPFKDTSYKPSIYYNWDESGKGYNPNSWKFGLEHESNGRDGNNSRSLNMAFIQPIWNIDFSGGKTLSFMPKFYHYLEKSDNRDLHHYRGNVDWIAKYGREDAAILTGMYRQGTDGYAQGQLDLSYPISDKLFGRTGTFLHLQLFGGYGETFIDYNKRSETQLRIGISLTR